MYWRTYIEAIIYISAVFLLGFVSGVILIGWISLERGSRLRNQIVLLRRRVKELEDKPKKELKKVA